MAVLHSEAKSLRARLVEAKSQQNASERVAALQAKLAAAEEAAANLGDVIMRQKTIRGLWIPAKPLYVKAEAELKHARGQLEALGFTC